MTILDLLKKIREVCEQVGDFKITHTRGHYTIVTTNAEGKVKILIEVKFFNEEYHTK